MRFARGPLKPETAMFVLAALSVALGLMCAGLAVAWRHERDQAACWRAAALTRLEMEESCGG